ncbi:hypothetical protein [Kribbella deserti]|uniref:Uncharacterized protein n=1 Tax=Kribbella deserti TaxID=1926257 RepID=A0ABV6QPG7_9ACTN
MIALHLGGIPELAMVLGPLLLIAAFIRIARRGDAAAPDEDWGDEWNDDLGDRPAELGHPSAERRQPAEDSAVGSRPNSS